MSAGRLLLLGRLTDIPLGEGRPYQVDGEMIAVFRLRDGRVFALENTCPHRGGSLADGIIGGDEVVCPLHAWKFNLTTGQGITDPCGVRHFAVREHDGWIYLSLSSEATDRAGGLPALSGVGVSAGEY